MWAPPVGQTKGTRVKVVPFINGKFKYDAELEAKVFAQTPNDKFVEQVQKAFPNKEAKIMVRRCRWTRSNPR